MIRAALAFALFLAAAPALTLDSAQTAPAPAATSTPAAPTPVAAPAPAAAPIIRTTLDPKEGAVVGQHIALYVDVLFPGDMPRPPRVAIPDLAGAQVMRFETQATTIRDTIDGTAYVGQRFEFAVFPRRSGPLSIPPATVTLLDRSGDVTGTIGGQPVQETIVAPEGLDANTVVVATEKLTLAQSWKPDPGGAFHPGDALVRTITRTATDIPALAMRDLAFPAPDGVRVYVDAPVSQDQSDRGTITGKRVDRATYVFEKSGTFELPAVTQPWWNLADKQANSAVGAAATATVMAGLASKAPAATESTAISRPLRPAIWATIAAFAILAALALATIWRNWREHAAPHRAEEALSESAAFHALTRACGSDDAAATYKALATWRARLPAFWPGPPDASALEMALFAGGPAWTKAMAKAYLVSLRRYRETELAHPRHQAPAPLPPLNPRGKKATVRQ